MLVKPVAIWICEACLNGEGEECHTPDCALFLHAVDLPIHEGLYTVLAEHESIESAECDHEWIDARNEAVMSGEVCLKCSSVRARQDTTTD